MSYRVEGTYLESCNCDAICPCRRVGGVPGGRSTHGICLGVLSWFVETGEADGEQDPGFAGQWGMAAGGGGGDERLGAEPDDQRRARLFGRVGGDGAAQSLDDAEEEGGEI